MLKQCLRQKHHEFGGLKEHKWIRCDKYGYFKPLQKQEKEIGFVSISTEISGKETKLPTELIV